MPLSQLQYDISCLKQTANETFKVVTELKVIITAPPPVKEERKDLMLTLTEAAAAYNRHPSCIGKWRREHKIRWEMRGGSKVYAPPGSHGSPED